MAVTEPERRPGALLGRERECAAIEGLLRAARNGESGCLIIRGEPGIGKSALLSFAERAAGDSTVLLTAGREAESGLAFAGLHWLLRPIAGRLGDLPKGQADALAGALGLTGPQRQSDRFLVAAATLSLLAAASDDQPLVCLIDDAQWLDSASAEALLFAARRLRAEPVAVLFAVRENGDPPAFSAAGLPEIRLESLPSGLADRLLSQAAPTACEPARAWLLNAAAGNPLALLELPGALTDSQLIGRGALPETVALTARLRVAFAQRIDSLPATARDALLIAALEEDDELDVVLRAAAHTGLPEDCLDPAERSGLVSIAGGVIAFRHPLVRAAVAQAATVNQLRRAHAALAAALEHNVREDRSLWHRALASLAPDEQVAAALDAAACRAGHRGAHGVAASALARARS